MKWIVGASIIAAALGWAGTMTIPAVTITPDEATLKYFPQETQGIVFVDAAALRNAPLIQDAMDKGQLQSVPPGLKEFMDKTAFDIRRDVDRVTIGKISARERLVVAHARYDKFKAEQFWRDKGKEAETYLGRAVYRDGDTAITFLDGIILFGTENAVKGAIDRVTYPGVVQIGTDLLKAIQTIEAGNQVWAVGNFSEEDLGVTGLHQSTPAAQILKTLRRGTYQMKVDSGLHARATGNFSDADSAGNLVDMARGLIAVAKLQVAKQQPDLLQMLDGIQISSKGSTVIAQVDEPGDLLKKIQDYYRPTFERKLR